MGSEESESSTVDEEDSESATETETETDEVEVQGENEKVTLSDETVNLKTAFPDDNFRSIVVKALNDSSITVDTETIDKSKLENITEIYSYMDNVNYNKTDSPIISIEGIDLLTNLTKATFRYHEINDISEIEWGKLTNLEYLNLMGNNLKSVPDFSSNTKLNTLILDENILDDATIAAIKVPSDCTVDTDDQRVYGENGLGLIVEENYYFYNDKLHLFVRPTGYKSGLSNNVKFYVDDNDSELSMERNRYNTSCYYNGDAELSEGSHKIKAVMTINGKTLTSEEYSFNVVKQSVFAGQDKYYVPSTSDKDISIVVYSENMSTKIQKAQLIGNDNKVYAEDTDVWANAVFNDPRYTKISYYTGTTVLKYSYLYLERLKNSIPVGTYSVKVTYEDGTEDTLNDIVEVTTEAVITGVYGGYDYDKTGDYIFLSLEGSGISPENLEYSFTYNKKTYTAEYQSYKPTTSGVIVKLKKDSSMPRKNDMSVTVNLAAKTGNTIHIPATTSSITLSQGIFWFAYNNATNQFETGISAILGREGTVDAELWSDYKGNDNATKLATSSSSLNDDGIAYFTFKTDNDTEWLPTKSGNYYVYCTYGETTVYRSEYINVSTYSSSVNYWNGYSKYLKGTGNTTFYYYEGAEYNSSDIYESSITGDSLTEAEALTATVSVSDNSDNTTGTQIVGISQKYDLSNLEVGNYTITITKNDEILATKSIEIMQNYFILDYFSASWQDDKTISIYLSSPNYVKDDDGYVVTLIDPTGEEVTNLTTTLKSGYANSYFYLNVTGLNKSDAYKKYYIKVTHKTLGEAKTENDSGEYVDYFKNEKGEYKTISTSLGYFTGNTSNGVYRVQGINSKNLTYPIQLTVYRPYDATKIVDLTIDAANNGENYYYWSEDEVYNKLPNIDELYDVVAVDANKNVIMSTETHIGYKTINNNTWTITTSNSQLKVGEIATIKVSGNKATPKFTSNDTNVVTVKSENNTATLTAVGIGTADITITADNISRNITITVSEKIFSDEEQAAKVSEVGTFYVDLKTDETKTLEDVTLPEGWTWVKPTTKLTTDKIEYEAKYEENGYEPFTANLNVYSYKFNGITLTGSDRLNKGASETYIVSYDIEGTVDIKDSDVKWELSEGSALEITSKDKDNATVKAIATGEQTLTVTVGEFSKTINITVYAENSVTDIEVSATTASDNGIGVLMTEDETVYVDKTFISNLSNSFVLSAKGYIGSKDKESDTPLKWTSESDNTDVAEITENGTVKVNGEGNVEFKVTAQDDGNYSKTIKLVVGDFAPKFEGTKVTLYSKTSSTSLPIYVNAVNAITSVEVNGSDNIESNVENKNVVIFVKTDKLESITKKITEKVTFTFTTDLGKYTTDEIAVTIDTTVPSVTLKQSAKLNVFYKSGEVSFTVTSKNQIEDITFMQNNGGEYFDSVTFDGSVLTLLTKKDILTSDISNNGIEDIILNIKFKDYGTLKYKLIVATEYKTPSLAINAANVIAGQTSFTTNIVDKKTKEVVSDITKVELTPNDYVTNEKVDKGVLTFDYKESKNTSYNVTVGSDNWNGTVALIGKVTYVKNPKVVFGSKAAIITKDAKKSVVPVSIKDSSVKLDAESTIKVPKNADSNLNVYFDADSQSIVAEYTGNITKGATYSYTFTPKTEDGTELKDTTFKVKVEAYKTATVKFATKGSINLINANEYVTVTPTLNNTTANIESIELTEEGADKFVIESLGNGKYKLAYDDEVVAGLEATQYTLKATAILDDGNTVTDTIKVKPVIKLPKVKADVTKGTLYKSSDKTVVANLTTTSKTGSNPIDSIKIVDSSIKGTNYTADELFNVDFTANEVSPSNGTVTVSLSDIGKSELNAGKYNVTCKVYYKSGAAATKVDKTAATVKFTITVK